MKTLISIFLREGERKREGGREGGRVGEGERKEGVREKGKENKVLNVDVFHMHV